MKYVITGGSGYIGTRLTELLVARDDTERVVIADLRPPRFPHPKVEFHRTDVRDRPGLRSLLERIAPDALVHLAFVLNPIRDEGAMYDIDVNGTLNALDAAAAAGTPHVLVTSSTTAYGAWPDNPEPIGEDWILRGQPTSPTRATRPRPTASASCGPAEHPDRTMTIVRPVHRARPERRQLHRARVGERPFLPRFRGEPDQNVQFVHEDDLAEAISGLLVGRHAGAFNVTGDGAMTWQETGEVLGKRVRTVPFRVLYAFNALLWRLHVPGTESPPGNLEFIRHPWVCSNEKVKETVGWTPKHSTRETFEETLRARGPAARPDAAPGAPSTIASPNGHGAQDPAAVA